MRIDLDLWGPSTLHVLYHWEGFIEFCRLQWCLVILTFRVLVSALLAEVLYYKEVTIECCPAQWCPATTIPRLLVSALFSHLLHHREMTIFCYIAE